MILNEYFKAYEAGEYSPKLLKPEDVEPGTIVVTEEDDNKRLEFARIQVTGAGKKIEVGFGFETIMMHYSYMYVYMMKCV